MCKKGEDLLEKIENAEKIARNIQSVSFTNYQSFESVFNTYEAGEVYVVSEVGIVVITSKLPHKIEFILYMKNGNIFPHHWQDADKLIDIKQGIYLDLLSNTEYRDKLEVGAFDISHFQSVGDNDLILK